MPNCSVCGTWFAQGQCPLCWPAVWSARPAQTALTRGIPVSTALALPTPYLGDDVVEGTVIQSSGPTHMGSSANWWKLGSGLLGFIALSPLVLVGIALRMVLSFVGLRRAGGRGLLDEIFIFHGLGRILQRPEPTPVYHHVVETNDQRHHLVQQRGEFVDSRVLVGHRVRLEGRRVRGTLLVTRGVNLTLGAMLSPPGNPWRAGFFGLLVLLSIEAVLAASWLGALRSWVK